MCHDRGKVWPSPGRSFTLRAGTIYFTRPSCGVIVFTTAGLPFFTTQNVTVPRVVSPFLSIEKLPRIPFVIFVPNSFDDALAREPSEFPIAVRSTSAACAAYAVYGSGCLPPRDFAKSEAHFLPAPDSLLIGIPGWLMYMPFAAGPAPWIVAEIGVQPSGPNSVTFVPSAARRS